MGICSSCLGRERDQFQEEQSTGLLFDDPHSMHYGSFGDQTSGTLQADPQDAQRETEALQKIVAQTSNYLVDIFAIIPQSFQRSPSTNFSGQDARLLQYQDVLAKMTADGKAPAAHEPSGNTTHFADWYSDDDDDDNNMDRFKIVETKGIGPLLGGFAEVESGMK